MAFPTDSYNSTDLAVMIPELWGGKINDYFKEDLFMADHFTDRSDELIGGGDTLYTPGLTAMTVNDKTNGAAVTLNSPVETSITLSVNNWKEVSFAIEDRELVQVKQSYTLQQRYAMNAGHAVGENFEQAIATLASSFTTSVGSNAAVITDAVIREAMAQLRVQIKSQFRLADLAYFFHPLVQFGQTLSIDRFAVHDKTGSQDPTKSPDFMLYGIPVFISTNIVDNGTGFDNYLAHKDAVHYAMNSLPQVGGSMVGPYGVRVQSNYIPEYLSTVTTADILYGVVMNRPDAGILILTSQATA